MAKCPNCKVKISPFDWKQTCKNCDVNILYYGLEERLEVDEIIAEKEYAGLGVFMEKLKVGTTQFKAGVARLAVLLLALVATVLPIFSENGENQSLIGVIKGIMGDGGLSTSSTLLLALAVCILLTLIMTLRSGFKAGFVCDILFTLASIGVGIGIMVLSGSAQYGLWIVLALMIVVLVLAVLVNKEKKELFSTETQAQKNRKEWLKKYNALPEEDRKFKFST